MEDGRFDNIIQNLIENKIDQLSNNEIFGLVSLLTLMEIITVFDKQSGGLNLPAESNLKQMVNSLQSGSQAGNNTDLNMLPLLLKLMGGSGELENLGNLSSLLGLLKKQNRESTTNTPDNEGETETETTSPDQSKKKTII